MTSFEPATLRRAFGSFMTGVTVVTARADNGELVGFTANSFTSVSINPPLLLVCPGNHLSSFNVFNSVTHFSVSILAEGQEQVSNTFASASENRFEQVKWQADDNGCPLIEGASATFSCQVHQRYIAGDHLLLIGQILQLTTIDSPALGYCSDGYFSLSKERQANASSHADVTGVAGALIEYNGRILMCRTDSDNCVPTVEQSNSMGARSALQQYFEKMGLRISLGPVYSVYDDTVRKKRFTFLRARAESGDCNGLGSFETIGSLAKYNFSDRAQATMMARFAAESRIRTYGLYIGNAESGELHPLAEKQD